MKLQCAVAAALISTAALAEDDAPDAATDAPAAADAGDAAAPPSTGKEMPKPAKRKPPTEAEAKAKWDELLASAKGDKRDCATLIGPLARLAFTLARPTNEEVRADLDAYLWMARCAEKQRYFVLLGDLGDRMLTADPKNGHPELLARAFLGLNSPKLAMKVLDTAEKAQPKDPELALTSAKTKCRIRDWSDCLKRADKTVKLAKALKGGEKNEVLNRAQKYRARALLHLGKVKDAEKAIALSEKLGGDPADLEELRLALVPAKTFQAVVETEHVADVALGVYHLIGKREDSKPLVRVHIANTGADRQFRVEAQIEGVTSNQVKTATLLKGKSGSVELTPPLLAEFNKTVSAIRAPRKAQLSLNVIVITAKGETKVHEETAEVSLEPRDFLPTATFVDEEKALGENLNSYMGAWVTPGAAAVDAFLAEAKKNHPKGAFSGEQSATIPQVRALYETLQAKGVSYVMDAEVMSGVGNGQRTRLPSDVLASTNAQCLEGALLYASLFEAIGLRGGIVLVPGHAFVAWYPSAGDGEAMKGQVLFLETTMTHDAAFERAVEMGKNEFLEARKNNKARVLLLADLRKQGITPQSFE